MPEGNAWASALLLVVALAHSASAEDTINLHHLYQPVDGHGFTIVDDAETLLAGEVHGGLLFSHAQDPLELGRPGDDRVLPLLRQLTMVDLYVAFGVLDGLSVGVSLPVVLDNDGRELNDFPSETRSGGVGSVRLQAKLTIWGHRDEDRRRRDLSGASALHFAFAIKGFMTFHTGRGRDYLADNESPTGGVMGMATVQLFGRMRIGLELGYEAVSSDIDFGRAEIEDRIRFGAATEIFILRPYLAPAAEAGKKPAGEGDAPADGDPKAPTPEPSNHALSIGGELFGWTNTSRPFHSEIERPIEGGLFIRYQHLIGLQVRLWFGTGLTNGLGAPSRRYAASVGWTF